MLVLRNGLHIPNSKFAAWSKAAILIVKSQLPRGFTPYASEVFVELDYYAEDRRRRDAPAILDSIWHILERAGVVKDDTHLWPTRSTRAIDRQNPRAELSLRLAQEPS